jgi:predicted permease
MKSLLDSCWLDLHFAFRMLRKNLAVTFVVILTLGLGVGVNTAIFSLVNGFLIRRLPVPAAERLAAVIIQEGSSPLGALGFSYPQFMEFRAEAAPFCDLFGQALGRVQLSADGHTDVLAVSSVSDNYFSALGVKPALGRLVLPGEAEHPGEPGILVLGYSYWQRRFGGDPQVIGKQVRANGKLATIVGVVSQDFRGQFSIFEMDAYFPLSTMFPEQSANGFWNNRSTHLMLSLGRLKPGVTIPQAQSRFDVISARLAAQYPATDKGFSVRVMDERLSRPIPYANNAFILISGLFLILAVVVLLLACTNIANILMARASARRREMAIRAALGGARSRLVRQMLIETSLLSLLGGIAGILLGGGLSRLFGYIRLAGFPLQLRFDFDWPVVAYAFAAVLFTALFAGLSPALRATRSDVNIVLHQGGRPEDTGKARDRVGADLMAAQVAGALMLLIVAALFVRSLSAAQRMDLGFDPDHLLNVRLNPALSNHTPAQTTEFYRSLEGKILALPGVQSVSLAGAVPIAYVLGRQTIHVEGRPVPSGRQAPAVLFNVVDPPYFANLHIPLLLGRSFADSDNENAQLVAIVNETMARQFWPGESPIGKRFSNRGDGLGPFLEIVGVARDGKYRTLGEDPEPYLYLPLAQNFLAERVLQVRSSLGAESLARDVQREILALDANAPISEVQSMKEALSGALGYFIFRLGASLAAAMGLLGLFLAVVGVYGVVSYTATQRTHEIGIRMALGATPAQVFALLLKQALQLLAAGLFFGLVGALAFTRFLSHLLVGISPSDPGAYFSVSALLAFVTLLACWIPARRALRVDPMVALRHE